MSVGLPPVPPVSSFSMPLGVWPCASSGVAVLVFAGTFSVLELVVLQPGNTARPTATTAAVITVLKFTKYPSLARPKSRDPSGERGLAPPSEHEVASRTIGHYPSRRAGIPQSSLRPMRDSPRACYSPPVSSSPFDRIEHLPPLLHSLREAVPASASTVFGHMRLFTGRREV